MIMMAFCALEVILFLQYALVSGFILQSFRFTDDVYRCPKHLMTDKHVRTFQDQCYEFVTYKEKYWLDARKDCNSRGGDLVIVDSDLKQSFVTDVLKELNVHNPGVWLGLEDRHHELHWHWVNGEPLSGYSHWAGHQGYGPLHYTQDCAMIRMDDGGFWHDRECHLWPNDFPYICQYDLLPTTTMESTTPAKTSPSSSTPITAKLTTRSTTNSATCSAPLSQTTPPAAKILSSNSESTSQPEVTPAFSESKTAMAETGKAVSVGTTKSSPLRLETSRSSSTINLTHAEVIASTSYNEIKSNTDITSERDSTSGTSTMASKTTPFCTELDCRKECPNGYTGIYVGIDGCISCTCKR